MLTRAKYNFFNSGDEICFMVLHELDAHGFFCFRINNNFRHCRVLGQMKVRSVTNWPEKSFIGTDSVTVSQIRLHCWETNESITVVIYQIVTKLLASLQETFPQRSGVRRSRNIQVSVISVISTRIKESCKIEYEEERSITSYLSLNYINIII